MIDTDVFSTKLNSAACINNLQKCDVDETLHGHDKARKLLVFLLQSSLANYEDFVKCLKATPQRHVAKILENDVGELIAQVNRNFESHRYSYHECKKNNVFCLHGDLIDISM